MLGIGVTLVCLRAMKPAAPWNEGLVKLSFWSMNIGLFLMCVLSLLPVGLLQTWASVERGCSFARSEEFLHTPLMQVPRWLRPRRHPVRPRRRRDGLLHLHAVRQAECARRRG
jgi:nitric oxide reductase subunit B